MDYRFLHRFEREHTKKLRIEKSVASALGQAPTESVRKTDEWIWTRILAVTTKNLNATKALKQVETILTEHKTVNQIVMSAGCAQQRNEKRSIPENKSKKQSVLYKGTHALYLTCGEMIEKRAAAEEKEREESDRKTAAKINRERAKAKKDHEKERNAAARMMKKRKREAQKQLDEVEKGARKRLRKGVKAKPAFRRLQCTEIAALSIAAACLVALLDRL